MSVRYFRPIVRNSYQMHWWVDYVELCAWRWVFREGGCE